MPLVRITPAERELLLVECILLDDELVAKLEKAALLDGWHTFKLEAIELEDFIDHVAANANHAKNMKQEKLLDALCDRLEELAES